MPSDVIEPTPAQPPGEPGGRRPAKPVVPKSDPDPDDLVGSSTDELSLSLSQPRPDPMLGSFDESDPAVLETPKPANSGGAPAAGHRGRQGPGRPQSGSPAPHPGGISPGSFEVITNLAGTGRATRSERPGGGSKDSITSLGLDLLAESPETGTRPVSPGRSRGDEADLSEEDDGEAGHGRGLSLPLLLLASYSSAVTLGLLWVLWSGRRLPPPETPSETEVSAPQDTRADPGLRAERTRKLGPLAPIPEAHTTTLGKTVRLGLIEVTPLSVTSGNVSLAREFRGSGRQDGGKHALKLRLRLRNSSSDTIIAPLDEAFLRERPGADPDTLIDCGPDRPVIAMFPLAVESEWSIEGQTFRDLRPGEEFVTDVVSVPGATTRTAPSMTWRVRLRTDLNLTETLGVRFQPDEISPKP